MDNIEYQDFYEDFKKIRNINNKELYHKILAYQGYIKICNALNMHITDIKNLAEHDLSEYNFMIGLSKYDLDNNILEWLINLQDNYYEEFLKIIANDSSNRETKFIKIANFTLKVDNPKKFMLCTNFLKDNQGFTEYYEKIYPIIDKNIKYYIKRNDKIDNEYLLYFSSLNENNGKKYFKEDYLPILENTSIYCYTKALENEILNEDMINNKYFYNGFKKLDYRNQLYIIYVLEEREYNNSIIKKLKNNLNKPINPNNIEEYFQMHIYKLKVMYKEFKKSSYVKLGLCDKEEAKVLEIFNKAMNSNTKNLDFLSNNEDYYNKIISLYNKVISYATDSIVSSLYDPTTLPNFINNMKEDQYNILINVNEVDTNSSFSNREEQYFDRFSIITKDNFSHTMYQNYIYGYYTDIRKENITLIIPHEATIDTYVKYKYQVSKGRLQSDRKLPSDNLDSSWMDITEFNKILYYTESYGSIIMRVRGNGVTPPKPDVLISIGDKITRDEIREASSKNLKILRLKKNKNTVMHIEHAPSHHLG